MRARAGIWGAASLTGLALLAGCRKEKVDRGEIIRQRFFVIYPGVRHNPVFDSLKGGRLLNPFRSDWNIGIGVVPNSTRWSQGSFLLHRFD